MSNDGIPIPNPKLTYPAVKRCIYCGDTKSKLGREHVIPLSLAGEVILPEASCSTCGDITKKFEQECTRTMLGAWRAKLNLPTRRPEERPDHFEFSVRYTDGTHRKLKLSADNTPVVYVAPEFKYPGILEGSAPSSKLPYEEFVFYEDNSTVRRWRKRGGITLGTILPVPFARMVAKIAHAFATAEYRVGSFKPTLIDAILGRSDHISHWVGCEKAREPPEQIAHNVRFSNRELNGQYYICVSLRLFPFTGSPTYLVVAGICDSPLRVPMNVIQQKKNTEAFEKMLAFAFAKGGSVEIAPLTEDFTMKAPNPKHGGWYYVGNCPRCSYATPLFRDPAKGQFPGRNGPLSSPLKGPGTLKSICHFCRQTITIAPETIVSRVWSS